MLLGTWVKRIANWVSKRAKFPKFKGRGHKQSFTTDEQSVRVEGKRDKVAQDWVDKDASRTVTF